MNKKEIVLLVSLTFLFGCKTSRQVSSIDQDGNGQSVAAPTDYSQVFQSARELLKDIRANRQDPRFKNYKNLVESEIIEFLEKNPGALNEERLKLLEAIRLESANLDITKHHRLMPLPGTSGYSNLQFFVNHPYYFEQRLVRPTNLVNVWKEFLQSAKKEIVLNVFDFDLVEIADTLIARSRAGVKVRVGIDKGVIEARPQVKVIYDRLSQGGVIVTAIRSVGLNHQKMAAIDWSLPRDSKVLLSSGNLTQSCMDPGGDLSALKLAKPPPESVPNANHVITMRSWILANLINHELTKTLDPGFLLRGSEYPATGAYQVTGPTANPASLEAYPKDSLIITFTPGGAFKSVNKNFLARLIDKTSGRVRMIQFAYSSADIDQALQRRARREIEERGRFDYGGIGDTPFAMQFWSQFLNMSGWEIKTNPDKSKKWYAEEAQGPWLTAIGPQAMTKLRSQVRIAPAIYGNNWVMVNGKNTEVTSKIHHKILSTGDFAVVGTSFNFSEGAESNNEQVVMFRNPELVKRVEGMYRWLAERSPRSVDEEAKRRNTLPRFEEASSDDTESRSVNSAAQAAPPN